MPHAAESQPVPLAEIVLTDAAGAPAPLADLWAERTAVLVLLRHFG